MVVRTTTTTDTTASASWSFNTASVPMFSRTTESGTHKAVYAASATSDNAQTEAQKQVELSNCKSLVAKVGGQCDLTMTVPGDIVPARTGQRP